AFAPALGQHEFFLRFQHWEPPDLFQISGKTALGGHDRQSRSPGHKRPPSVCPRVNRQAMCTVAPRADGTSCCDRENPRSPEQHNETYGAKGSHTVVTPRLSRRTFKPLLLQWLSGANHGSVCDVNGQAPPAVPSGTPDSPPSSDASPPID